MNNSPIFITGIPRSGIALTANLFSMKGVFGGLVDKRNTNMEINDLILDPYFLLLGDVTCQRNLPLGVSMPLILNLRDEVCTIIEKQQYSGGRWFIKDPRLILMHPILDEAFPDADWVVVRRDEEEIARSCMKTNYMNAYKTKKDWLKWIRKFNKIIDDVMKVNFNFSEIHPTNFIIDNNFDEINRVFKDLETQEE